MMDIKIYPSTMTLHRSDYPTKAEYITAYRDCNQHYGYKVRVFGGWKFFETATDMQTWKAQQ